jgi:predicted transcriptional regulator
MYYLNINFIIYKITRGIDTMNDNIKKLWVNIFDKREQDQGYTVVDSTRDDHYLSYEELWEL